jgi:hypothetical protein
MENKPLAERLRLLAAESKGRSKTARLRAVIEEVEAALAAGVPRHLILAELATDGLDLTPGTFAQTLLRIRRKRRSEPGPTVKVGHRLDSQQTGSQLTSTTGQNTGEPEGEPPFPSHNPEDLRKIIAEKPDLDAYAKYARDLKRDQAKEKNNES